MISFKLLSILSLLFLRNAILDGNIGTPSEKEVLCEADLTKFIEFPYNLKCLQIVLNKNHQLPCVPKLHELHSTSLQIRSFKYLKHRDINTEIGQKCQTFLIFAESWKDLKEIFVFNQSHNEQQFFPYTKIYLYVYERSNNDHIMSELKTFLAANTLFGYVFEHTKADVVIRDVLTNDIKQSVSSYNPSDLFHPMVDTRLAKDDFRISVFNCKPLTTYPDRANDSM